MVTRSLSSCDVTISDLRSQDLPESTIKCIIELVKVIWKFYSSFIATFDSSVEDAAESTPPVATSYY